MTRKRKPLFWYIYPAYMAIIVVSLFLVTGYATRSMRQFYLHQIEDGLKKRAQLLRGQISAYLQSNDFKSVDNTCKLSGALTSTRITVVLQSGLVIGDSDEAIESMDNHGTRPEIRSALTGKTGSSVRFSKTLQKNMMYVAIPIKTDQRLLGVLRTSISVSDIDETVKVIQIRIGIGGLFIALIAALISLYVSKRISRPVEEMQQGAELFSKGNFSHKLPVPESDELARLAESMNQMALNLDDRIKTVIAQRNELEAVLSSMVEGVLAIDTEDRVMIYNQAIVRMFKLSEKALLSRSLNEIIRSSELQRFVVHASTIDTSIEEDITVFIDTQINIRIHSTPLKDATQSKIGTLFVLFDVTKIKRLENMRRDFAVNVSHELKTPLTAIKGFVETITHDDKLRPEDARRFLNIITKHVGRLEAIIDDLMQLSKIENQEILLDQHPLCHVIEGAATALKEKAEKKSIQIKWSCDPDIAARINAPLLERALVNLIDNAINYSNPETTIDIDILKSNRDISIKVKDHGIGIAPKHHDRIFERFYRVDKARSRECGGTGLGLALVKHIVIVHGGQMKVDSQPGKGSLFEIKLPV